MLFLFALFLFKTTAYVPRVDIDALWSLYNATNGHTWIWRDLQYGRVWDFTSTDDIDPCADQWQGIQCFRPLPFNCSIVGYMCNVSAIYTSNMNLTGQLPLEFGNFTALQDVDMSYNHLTGSLPSTLGKLSTLRTLVVSYNYLSKQLPSVFGSMTSLSYLNIYSNSIRGTIPNSLMSLNKLNLLYLHYNELTGTIPTKITTNLVNFYLESNHINGTIPSTLGLATKLHFLFLDSNSLSGTIPSTFGSLRNVITMSVGRNNLNGTIPNTFIYLNTLGYLDLESNSLSGSLPLVICHMTNLEGLFIFHNSFTGTIPLCFNQLHKLGRLYAGSNQFNGTIPDIFHNILDLYDLDLSYNALTGSIPTSLYSCTKLYYLQLNNNLLTGSISEQISGLKLLIVFSFNNNYLTGSLPLSITSSLLRLQLIYIQNNLLSSSLPSSYSNLQSLRFICGYSNYFTNIIPSNLNQFLSLVYFDMNNNYLTGSIPSHLTQMTQLEYFHLFNNHLIGPLPSSISQLKSLKYLLIQNNYLTSSIVLNNFLTLTKLEVLQIQRNHFTGKFFQYINETNSLNSSSSLASSSSLDSSSSLASLPSSLSLSPSSSSSLASLPSSLFSSSSSSLRSGISSYQINSSPLPQITGLSKLRLLDLSQNLFTGSFPYVVFQLTSLESLILTSNCFHGILKFDDTACQHSTLQVMIFDGLASCQKHTLKIWNPFISNSNEARTATPHSAMSGTIPSCLFHMPQLHVLHLGGNHLTGVLPDISNISGIQNLSLTNNKLSGTIPRSILTHSFVEIDLSHNKLTGTIDMMKSLPSSSFVVKNNRLSGQIPKILLNSPSSSSSSSSDWSSSMDLNQQVPNENNHVDINILEGNAFTCKNDNEQPDSDPGQGKYSCGSTNIDDALLVWLISGIICLGIILFLSYYGHLHTLYQDLHHSITIISQFDFISKQRFTQIKRDSEQSQNLASQIQDRLQLSYLIHLTSMHNLQNLSLHITLFNILIMLPLLCLIKSFKDSQNRYLYSTYFVQESWYPTGIYVSGTLPATCLLIGWILVILFALWNIMKYHRLFCELYYPLKYIRGTTSQRQSLWNRFSLWTDGSEHSNIERITALSDSDDEDNDNDNDDGEEKKEGKKEEKEKENEKKEGEEEEFKTTNTSPGTAATSSLMNSPTSIPGSTSGSISASTPSSSKKSPLPSRLIFTLFLLMIIILDIFLVFLINFSYLLLQESHTSSRYKLLGQLVLALFKTIFSNAIIPSITNVIFEHLHYTRSVHLLIRTCSLVLNNLLIPAVVISLTSSSCFLNVFYANDPINESYELKNSTALCDYQFTETGLVECNEYGTAYFESESFIPQFAYNYECTNFFATTYFPVYVYSYALLSFIIPSLTIFLLIPTISQRIPHKIRVFLPTYLIPLDDIQQLRGRKQVTNALGVMSALLYHFCMLLCLGILVPILGVIIMIHITILVIQYDISVGRYFSNSLPTFSSTKVSLLPTSTRDIYTQAFQEEVKSLWRGPYLVAKYILFLVVFVMSCFLLDQASDRNGWKSGVWIIPTIIIFTCGPAWALWQFQSVIQEWNTSFSSSIMKVDIWLKVINWLSTFGVKGAIFRSGSYEILSNKEGGGGGEGDEVIS